MDALALTLQHSASRAVQDGSTPLFICAQKGYLEVVKALLEKGADVNAKRTVSIARGGLEKVGDVGEKALVGKEGNGAIDEGGRVPLH